MTRPHPLLTGLLVLMCLALLPSCKKIPELESDGFTQVMLSRKTGYGNDWIYFSLSQGKELAGIDESNRAADLTWDLAFNRYNVRTNSGLSGNGMGGALDTGLTDMNKVPCVPDGEFTTDTMGEITKHTHSMPPAKMDSPLNSVLADAIHFGMPPVYTPNNHVYIVRTADGKYAKIKILGFYNEQKESGYVTFEYEYQPDGTPVFNR